MNTDRLFKLIITDLTSDLLKQEEELERVINDNTLETELKLTKVKTILNAMTIAGASMSKLTEMLQNNNQTTN